MYSVCVSLPSKPLLSLYMYSVEIDTLSSSCISGLQSIHWPFRLRAIIGAALSYTHSYLNSLLNCRAKLCNLGVSGSIVQHVWGTFVLVTFTVSLGSFGAVTIFAN